MSPAQRRALDEAHDLVHEMVEHHADALLDRLHEALHRAGAGQPTAAEDMRRLAEIGHDVDLSGLRPARLPFTHADDCPIVGAMMRYPLDEPLVCSTRESDTGDCHRRERNNNDP